MNDTTHIIWFDPGRTTGVAWYDTDADLFGSAQLTDPELAPFLRHFVGGQPERVAVGYEMYIQTPRPRPGSTAKHSTTAITIIREACEEIGIRLLKPQPSSARALRSTVVFLRRLGWYRPGKDHANDAACHLFRYLIRTPPVPENIRKRLPPGY